MIDDAFQRSMQVQNQLAEMGQREARQRRTVAEAAEQQLLQASNAVAVIIDDLAYFEG